MLKRMLTILCLLTPAVALTLGLGAIKVQSYLNQSLVAEIPILFIKNVRLGDVQVRLAPAKAYINVGLPIPTSIPGLQIVLTKNAAGKPIIRLTTTEIITDPAISFLLQVAWPNGSLFREYAILLNPQLNTK